MKTKDYLYIPYWQKFLVTIRHAELMDKKIDCTYLYKGYRLTTASIYRVVDILENEEFIKSEKKKRNRYLETTPKGKKIADGLMVLTPYIYDDVDTYFMTKRKIDKRFK